MLGATHTGSVSSHVFTWKNGGIQRWAWLGREIRAQLRGVEWGAGTEASAVEWGAPPCSSAAPGTPHHCPCWSLACQPQPSSVQPRRRGSMQAAEQWRESLGGCTGSGQRAGAGSPGGREACALCTVGSWSSCHVCTCVSLNFPFEVQGHIRNSLGGRASFIGFPVPSAPALAVHRGPVCLRLLSASWSCSHWPGPACLGWCQPAGWL